MARAFAEITFTDAVRAEQRRHGSDRAYDAFLAEDAERQDRIGAAEHAFISARDGFYQATVSQTGWPYVQFRGGPAGFVRVLDAKTLAYGDFRGNRQYLSVGNLMGEDRISLFFMDYANRKRLKVWGRARLVDAEADRALVDRLATSGYRAAPERAVVIAVDAFDWNCPQHITPRYTLQELRAAAAPVGG